MLLTQAARLSPSPRRHSRIRHGDRTGCGGSLNYRDGHQPAVRGAEPADWTDSNRWSVPQVYLREEFLW